MSKLLNKIVPECMDSIYICLGPACLKTKCIRISSIILESLVKQAQISFVLSYTNENEIWIYKRKLNDEQNVQGSKNFRWVQTDTVQSNNILDLVPKHLEKQALEIIHCYKNIYKCNIL